MKWNKHDTRFEDSTNSTNDNNKDESVESIIGRLLSTPPQNVSAQVIGTDKFIFMLADCNSERAQKKHFGDEIDAELDEREKRNFWYVFNTNGALSDEMF